MTKLALFAAVATAMALSASGPTRADLITSPGAISGSVSVIDFEAFSGIGYNFTFGPVQLAPDVVFTANPSGGGNTGFGSVLGEGHYVLGDNGFWDGTNSFSGLDSDHGSMTYAFDTPISGVGGFVNYVPDNGPVFIQVLNQNLSVIESYDLTIAAAIDTPNGFNARAFRGIQRANADIWAFRLVNSYIALDDLTYASNGKQVTDVPEPGVLAMISGGMLVGTMVLRRKHTTRRN